MSECVCVYICWLVMSKSNTQCKLNKRPADGTLIHFVSRSILCQKERRKRRGERESGRRVRGGAKTSDWLTRKVELVHVSEKQAGAFFLFALKVGCS